MDTERTLRRDDAAPGPSEARPFGRYHLLERVGRGGWGEVWKAFDPTLARHVAVKLLVGGVGDEERARFAREARIVAGLHHPNIVALFDHGRVDTVDFIAMQFIDGAPLSKLRLGVRDAVASLRDAARAVHAAHEAGLIHRDLKPANLMIESKSNRPFVLDFGLARRVEAGATLTATGSIAGTPQYMPPEQAAGLKDIGPRADVYGLGATLYDVLTGQPPFDGVDLLTILRRVVDDDPPPPRRVNPRLPVELDLIVQRAMEKDPARRYASAADFADDLDRFLRGDPVHARPASLLYRVGKRLRKHPVGGSLAALLFLALVGGASFGAWSLARASKAEADERRAVEFGQAVSRNLRLLDEIEDREYRPDVTFKLIEPLARRLLSDAEATLRSLPNDPTLLYLKGRALEYLGDTDAALASFTAASRADPADPRPWREIGVIFIDRFTEGFSVSSNYVSPRMKDDLRRAREAFDAAARVARLDVADEIRVWLPLTDLEFQRTIAAAAARIKGGGRTAPFYFASGLAKIGLEDYEGGLHDLMQAIDRCPGHHRALACAAWQLAVARRYPESLSLIDRALALRSPTSHAMNVRANALLGLHRYDEALAEFDKAIALDPTNAALRFNRANSLAHMGRVDEALAGLNAVIASDPSLHMAYLVRGNIHNDRGKIDDALQDYSEAIRLLPDYVEALYNRGGIYQARAQPDLALADYSKAIARRPKHAKALSNRGNILLARKDYDAALSDFERAIQLDPALFEPVLGRGYVLFDLGRFDDALLDFRRVADSVPQWKATVQPYIDRCLKALNGDF